MNAEDFTLLAERASTIEGRQADRLVEVHGRIRRARRRRRLGNVAALAMTLALMAGTAVLVTADKDQIPPTKPTPSIETPTPTIETPSPTIETPSPPVETPTPPVETPTVVRGKAPSVRRLTYGPFKLGTSPSKPGTSPQTIHFGDRTIDAGRPFWYVDATDDGAVFVEYPDARNGGIWFTDGSAPVRIGQTAGSRSRGYRIASSNAGSILAWEEPTEPNDAEIVVYATDQRRVVARFGVARSGPPFSPVRPERIEAVYDDSVYWKTSIDGPRDTLMRYEVSTGTQVEVSRASFEADQRNRPRTIVVGKTAATAVVKPAPRFRRVGSRLVARGGTLASSDRDYDSSAFESRTGRPLELSVPTGYTSAEDFQLVQWLDDDRLALKAFIRGSPFTEGYIWHHEPGDFLICTVSSGICTVAVQGSASTGIVMHLDDSSDR
ncbi:MAG: hypothetical protein ABIM89_10145 [Mycobacteriales bacterium]